MHKHTHTKRERLCCKFSCIVVTRREYTHRLEPHFSGCLLVLCDTFFTHLMLCVCTCIILALHIKHLSLKHVDREWRERGKCRCYFTTIMDFECFEKLLCKHFHFCRYFDAVCMYARFDTHSLKSLCYTNIYQRVHTSDAHM